MLPVSIYQNLTKITFLSFSLYILPSFVVFNSLLFIVTITNIFAVLFISCNARFLHVLAHVFSSWAFMCLVRMSATDSEAPVAERYWSRSIMKTAFNICITGLEPKDTDLMKPNNAGWYILSIDPLLVLQTTSKWSQLVEREEKLTGTRHLNQKQVEVDGSRSRVWSAQDVANITDIPHLFVPISCRCVLVGPQTLTFANLILLL